MKDSSGKTGKERKGVICSACSLGIGQEIMNPVHGKIRQKLGLTPVKGDNEV